VLPGSQESLLNPSFLILLAPSWNPSFQTRKILGLILLSGRMLAQPARGPGFHLQHCKKKKRKRKEKSQKISEDRLSLFTVVIS
jgi:hypothetical protein